MEFSIAIDDSNVDVLARRLGWTDNIVAPNSLLSASIPNTVDQSTWIANKATDYLNNELTAAIAISAAEAARKQAIQGAQVKAALNTSTVTTPSPLPPAKPPIQ